MLPFGIASNFHYPWKNNMFMIHSISNLYLRLTIDFCTNSIQFNMYAKLIWLYLLYMYAKLICLYLWSHVLGAIGILKKQCRKMSQDARGVT